MSSASTETMLGIDLSSTNLRVGVWQNDRVEIIPTIQSISPAPSFVDFTNSCLSGDGTKYNLSSTAFSITRLIGRKFTDSEVQEEMKYWPFNVTRVLDDRLLVMAQVNGKTKMLQPVEILAMMLAEIRVVAQDYTDKEVKIVVVAVPDSFSYFQRQEILDAGAIAGLNLMRMINSSTAASIAYGLELEETVRNVLVFHLDDSALSVSLVTIEEGTFEVRATAGDTYLGGESFGNRLVEFFQQEFKSEHGKDLWTNKNSIHRLRLACNQAVQTLSSSDEAFIELDALIDGIDFDANITRERFELLCGDLFRKTLIPVDKVLKSVDHAVDKVILVGVSSRIPNVKQLLTEFLNGKLLSRLNCTDEAVVFGVTIQAAILASASSPTLKKFELLDIMPMPLGIKVDGALKGVFYPSIPMTWTETVTTFVDNQSVMHICVFEGASWVVRKDQVLCSFDVNGIPAMAHGVARIDVEFAVDEIGVLKVTAVEKSTGKVTQGTIEGGRISPPEIERLREEVAVHAREIMRVRSKEVLENYANSLHSSAAKRIATYNRGIEDMRTIKDNATGTLRWLGANDSADKEEFDVKRQKLEVSCTNNRTHNPH